MKIISAAGETPVTNAEVFEWLKEKRFAAEKDDRRATAPALKAPSNTLSIANHLQKYFHICPSGTFRNACPLQTQSSKPPPD